MRNTINLILLVLVLSSVSCKNTAATAKSGYQGQGPTTEVSTLTQPIQKQWKGVWTFKDSTVFFSNQFEGARLNGVAHDGGNHYTALITPENAPINPSPWYAFKIWSSIEQKIVLKITYQNSRSRYFPKISWDGIHFKALDSTLFKPINQGEGEYGIKASPEAVELTIQLSPKPIWVCAQELFPSKRVYQWMDSLTQKDFASSSIIGKSRENRDLKLLTLNAAQSKRALVIISRQHPPEVTGFIAMKAFIETLANDSELSTSFREKFTVFNIPMMNPDGVDNGHWRHNSGGIDLNRDWHHFNQPESNTVRDFLQQQNTNGFEFVFGIDFHSTWDDIYYPLDTTVTGDSGKIVYRWIEKLTTRLPSKKTNISPTNQLYPTLVSRNHFFEAYGMPAIVFELGDNTSRTFLKEKGKVAAEELMKLLLAKENP